MKYKVRLRVVLFEFFWRYSCYFFEITVKGRKIRISTESVNGGYFITVFYVFCGFFYSANIKIIVKCMPCKLIEKLTKAVFRHCGAPGNFVKGDLLREIVLNVLNTMKNKLFTVIKIFGQRVFFKIVTC